MKAKKVVTLALAAAMATAATASVSAADIQLTPENPQGKTHVIARVEGVNPGSVSYIITIPDLVDFEQLTQPQDDNESFNDKPFDVVAYECSGLNADTEQVSVFVKDENAVVNGDVNFYIANESDPTIKFSYDVFDVNPVTAISQNVNSGSMTGTAGYHFCDFTVQDFTDKTDIKGTLRLDQHQLDGKDMLAISGNYSGYMVFFSSVTQI